VGILCGTLLVGQASVGDVRTPAMTRAVAVEGMLLLIFAVLWLVTGTKPQGDVVPVLLGLASMAMGIQRPLSGASDSLASPRPLSQAPWQR
jgi:hypothetical protein